MSWRGLLMKPFDRSLGGLILFGLSIAVFYLLVHVAFDAVVLALWGFPPGELPVWQSDQWWTDLVNAALIGYLPAAQAIARRGVARDLSVLRPRLRFDDSEMTVLTDSATGRGGRVARALVLGGIGFGVWLTFQDPSMSGGVAPSASDPLFVWSLARSTLTFWLIARFSVYDFRLTRIYLALGRNSLHIDLLNIGSLAPFVTRGQRSALFWVLLSSISSLFWLGDHAARGNLPFLLIALSMATFAFLGPLVALRKSIRAEKRAELDGLREQIRVSHDQLDTDVDSPRLANLVGYYRLIDGAQEWPVDAANLMKFIGYLMLGLGSWLGGAVVERILDSAIQG